MRYIKFLLSETFSEYKKTPLLTITAFFTLTVCFFSVFVSLRVLQKNVVIYRDIELAKRTYSNILAVSGDDGASGAALEDTVRMITSELNGKITGCTFSYSDDSFLLRIKDFGDMPGITLYPVSGSGSFEQFENRIIEGRGFSENELEGSEPVIIVEKNLMYNGSEISVGDTVTLGGKEFKIIGIGGVTSAPFGSIAQLNEAVSMNADKIVLPDSDKDTQAELKEILKTDEELLSDYERSENDNSRIHTDQILISVMIAALGGIITITLFKQILREQLSRIALLKICGCPDKCVAALLVTEIVFYELISFAAAAVGFRLCDGLLKKCYLPNAVSFSAQAEVLVIALVMITAFNMPSIIKVSKVKPSRIEVRR
ncbi:ABC transporter permease [Ruminococcus sp. Marseille-P6503]|uniref:ABC transporter permease n=1 Tax=Ruminococcus sp. Marseille-P6503 TaxID=2364796 RepID=UPI000F53622A|nr:ABC transporter permease [Ruminococcus sp. Marseille-P6503]